MVKGIGKFKGMLLALPILLVLMCGSGFTDVNISTEGTYTDTELTLKVYADTTESFGVDGSAVEPLVSYGVKVTYLPEELNAATIAATKNETDWYFGTADGTKYPYIDPDTSTEGAVVIIGGKIDENSPTDGVAGSKVLLGTVVFERIDTEVAPTISVELGKDGDYVNFCTNDGDPLDNTERLNFDEPTIVCYIEGDVNLDGNVNIADLGAVQKDWLKQGSDISNPNADLNGDGWVNIGDLGLVQKNWLKSCN